MTGRAAREGLPLDTTDESALDDLTRLNNELVTTQRRLAKKNAELEKVYRQMREMAVRDSLTGVYNRRGLREQASREIGRIARHGGSIVVLACDLDDLKTINDCHGHAAGDRVIESLVRRWTAELRQVDIVGRTGGDEFVFVLPDIDLTGGCAAAQRVLVCSRRDPIDVGSARLFVTVSIGIVAETGPAELDELLNRADEALYRAKDLGRNRLAT